MNRLQLLIYFSSENRILSGKLAAISSCLGVDIQIFNNLDQLLGAIKSASHFRSLLITDESTNDFVLKNADLIALKNIEIALLVTTKIRTVAKQFRDLEIVRYFLEFDKNESIAGRHLAILIRKVKEQNFLDLEKYLGFGSHIIERRIQSKESKIKAINDINRFVNDLGQHDRTMPYQEYARRISEVTDELLLNAIFNANPRLSVLNRSKSFDLNQEEEVVLRWGYDGEYFGLSVRDSFGKIKLGSVLDRITSDSEVSEISESESAGLGQKIIYDRAHQIVANVNRKKVTEIIVIVKFESRLLDFDKVKKALFYFTDSRATAS